MNPYEPQQDRSREKRDRILHAADIEFGATGYRATQMSAIAARAGLAPGSLYRFFPNKEAIAVALTESYVETAAEVFQPIFEAIDEVGQVDEIGRRMVRSAAELRRLRPGFFAIAGESFGDGTPQSTTRSMMIEALEARMNQVGISTAGKRHRRALPVVLEVVRHLLFIGPIDGVGWDDHVIEIEDLVVAYMTAVFDPPA